MAKESKTLSVNPSEEQSNVEFWQDFGWELVSSQEIFNEYQKASVDYQGNKTLSTQRTNYVKLVFSRDTTIENHDKIVALEKKLPALPQKRSSTLAWIMVFAAIATMFMGIMFTSVYGKDTYRNAWTGLYTVEYNALFYVGIVMLIIAVAVAIFAIVLDVKGKATYNKNLSVILAQRNAIRLKAKEFLK